jgi:hypothetical protein
MLGSLLMRLLADLVVDSAATVRRSFDSEIDRYFQDQKLRSSRPQPSQNR